MRPLPALPWIGPLVRVHAPGRGPVWFGKGPRSRFDDPRAAYGVLYAGDSLRCAYLETLRVEKHPDDPAPPGPTEAWLAARSWSRLAPLRALRLVDLVEQQPALGVSGEILAGLDYTLSQTWSRRFYEHPDRVDGILYRARHDLGRRSIALFERPDGPPLRVDRTVGFLEDRGTTATLLRECGHVLWP
jgi:hypothetical protein